MSQPQNLIGTLQYYTAASCCVTYISGPWILWPGTTGFATMQKSFKILRFWAKFLLVNNLFNTYSIDCCLATWMYQYILSTLTKFKSLLWNNFPKVIYLLGYGTMLVKNKFFITRSFVNKILFVFFKITMIRDNW